ncbi:sarcalumenin isoform X3 [Pseudomyrmex gracilis]|uniref:sarcalumenin isoform X2 n=1 Tax=Pseudomyrmex gracilis TaxID=219809 RepID=UPI0009950C57|nr:sarcalumenin isoform X2 [Pseudomyrmex gracilis]XP_020277502.1 sarcalumenin isoform X3 [Pseudomyrmex gracilis]
MMTGARMRPALAVGLLLGLLAVALQGVQSEDELERIPSEDLCRPYIEKALKGLGTGSLEETSAEVGAEIGQESHEEGSPATEEADKAADEVSKEEGEATGEEGSIEEGAEATAEESKEATEEQASEEKAEAESEQEETEQSEEAATAEASQEGETEEAKDASAEATESEGGEQPDSAEKVTESEEEGAKSEEEGEKPSEEKSDEQAQEEKSEEATVDETKSEEDKGEESKTEGEEEEEQGESKETTEDAGVESKEEAEAQQASAEASVEEVAEEGDDSKGAEEGAESTEDQAVSDEGKTEEEAQSAEAGDEEKEKESAEDAGSEDVDEETKSAEEEEGKSAEEATAEEETKSAEEATAEEETKSAEEATAEEATAEEETKSAEEATAEEEAKSAEEASAEEEAKSAEEATTEEEAKSAEEATTEEEAKSAEEEVKSAEEQETKSEEEAKSAEEEGAKSEEEDEEAKSRGRREAEGEEGAEAGDESTEGAVSEEEHEPTPEEDLIQEIEIPENLRPRDHINQLLKLDEENEEKERAIQREADIILRDLKRLYDNAIKPLETMYKYRDLSNRHFGDPEIFSKPLVLFLGPWSGGKSSIINYLLDIEYTPIALRTGGLRECLEERCKSPTGKTDTGAEPSPAYFNIIMHGEEEEVLDGTQLAADWTFSGLQKFGQGLLDRLRGMRLNKTLLEKVNIVEIPGILEIRKQVQRLFPFNDACQWFIDRADIIFLVYDPAKLDVGPETEAILDQLKGREYQTRIILNKADQVKPEELMRVQGALIWNISPLMSSAEPPIMYSTSLWSLPYEAGAPTRLLYAQERAFLRDLRTAINKRVEHKIASARRFAVRVRNHAKMVDCYLTTYYNHKTFFGNKREISEKIIENPQDYHIYEGLSTLTNISRYDLPDPDVYRDFFRLNSLYDFPLLSSTCTYFRGCPINRLDVAIAYDLPELVGKYKKSVEAVLHENEGNSPPS